MKIYRTLILIAAAVAVAALGWQLRQRAIEQLPIDYDEDDYLAAAQRYAVAIEDGDLEAVIDYNFLYEHPPLPRLVYAFAILGQDHATLVPERPPSAPPADFLPQTEFGLARNTSAWLGTAQVFVLALLNPLAGVLLAVNTWQIKYTAQIMLEALPALTSLLTILAYALARKNGLFGQAPNAKRVNFWLALSAIGLGLTAASKYLYAIVGIVIIVDSFIQVSETNLERPKPQRTHYWLRAIGVLAAWGIFAILIFWAANPHLWHEPIQRLSASIFYHQGYATGQQVADAGFPTWQPLVWLAQSVPWHPGVFAVSIDLYVLVFAIIGLPHLWRKQRIFALWLGLAFLFLLLWPTKWPQYVLTLLAPLSLSASAGLRYAVWEPLVNWWQHRNEYKTAPRERKLARKEFKKAWLWLLPGTLTILLIAFYPMIYQGAMALTDFNQQSMRDGIQGGIWREAWQGLTGQTEPLEASPFEQGSSTEVHYVGGNLLRSMFSGLAAELLVFNVIWTVLSIALQVLLGVSVALVLNRSGLIGRGFWRTLFILPWAIPEFVGALIWVRLLDPARGWLAVAQNTGVDNVLSGFLVDPDKTLLLLLVAATWYGFPFIMLAATAGLKMIPEEVYEAAALDGAGRWQQFRYLTGPLLAPLVMPAILIRAIFAFNQFYLFYAMQTDFPTITFATLSYIFFAPGYFGGRFAVSAAINIFTVVILVFLILWFNRLSKAAEGVTYA